MKWLQACLQPVDPLIHDAAANCVLGAPREIDPAKSDQPNAGCDLAALVDALMSRKNGRAASELMPLVVQKPDIAEAPSAGASSTDIGLCPDAIISSIRRKS
jgi:hypothetical protein